MSTRGNRVRLLPIRGGGAVGVIPIDFVTQTKSILMNKFSETIGRAVVMILGALLIAAIGYGAGATYDNKVILQQNRLILEHNKEMLVEMMHEIDEIKAILAQ